MHEGTWLLKPPLGGDSLPRKSLRWLKELLGQGIGFKKKKKIKSTSFSYTKVEQVTPVSWLVGPPLVNLISPSLGSINPSALGVRAICLLLILIRSAFSAPGSDVFWFVLQEKVNEYAEGQQMRRVIHLV